MRLSVRVAVALLPAAGVSFAGFIAVPVAAQPAPATSAARAPKLVAPYRFPLDFKHFYDYDDLTATLKRVADRFPELTELRSLGRSRGGRDLWMLRLTDESAGDPDAKPGIYVDGNIHGNEIQAAEVCLYVIHDLVNRADRDPYIQELLRTRTFYVVPSVNPDSRQRFFTEPNSPHTPRGNVRPYDEDRDGRFDEDGPEDVNGDGVITSMRKRDPFGPFKEGSDPRSLRDREPDEKGVWTLYESEGIDNDGDGLINEDEIGGVDLNRNFPADWQPWSVQWGAGPYPTSEPEIRAVVEFIRSRPNIAALQSFHNSGNLVLYPYGSRPTAELPARDREIFESIAQRGVEILAYESGGILDKLYPVHGSTVDFAYLHWGIMAFTNELWAWVVDYDKDGRITREERLRWSDERLQGEAFVDWKPFRHPELGEVEIGGFAQFHSRVPPIGYLEEMCRLNSDFVLFHAEAMPLVTVTRTEATRLSAGVIALDVFIANTGIMDTYPQVALDLAVARPVEAILEVSDGVTILDGALRPRERALHTNVHSPIDRRRPRPERIEIGQIRGGTEIAVRWLLSGGGTARVTVRSDKAGTVVAEDVSLSPARP